MESKRIRGKSTSGHEADGVALDELKLGPGERETVATYKRMLTRCSSVILIISFHGGLRINFTHRLALLRPPWGHQHVVCSLLNWWQHCLSLPCRCLVAQSTVVCLHLRLHFRYLLRALLVLHHLQVCHLRHLSLLIHLSLQQDPLWIVEILLLQLGHQLSRYLLLPICLPAPPDSSCPESACAAPESRARSSPSPRSKAVAESGKATAPVSRAPTPPDRTASLSRSGCCSLQKTSVTSSCTLAGRTPAPAVCSDSCCC